MSADTTAPRRPGTTAGPAPDTAAASGMHDPYRDTVRTLHAHAETLHTALHDAAHAADEKTRTRTLHDLHRQLRTMAGLTNHALGGWPDPPEPT